MEIGCLRIEINTSSFTNYWTTLFLSEVIIGTDIRHLRARRALSPLTLYSDSVLLVPNGSSLDIESALLVLNWVHVQYCCLECIIYRPSNFDFHHITAIYLQLITMTPSCHGQPYVKIRSECPLFQVNRFFPTSGRFLSQMNYRFGKNPKEKNYQFLRLFFLLWCDYTYRVSDATRNNHLCQ